ncbi:ATP-binding protein [archaeon]|nr:ATP-binding protein [archaeon]PJC45229.1 MAG: hypothetical protein CO037_02615 [Candidatus Pacearchaeota archaeon CG_4_9_14_0_2_um_filter_30_8]
MNKYLISVEEIARKLKPILGKKIDEVYFRYMNAGSLEEKGEIFEILAGLYQKHLNKLLDKDFFLEPPKKESLEGKYALADVTYAGKKLFPFNLREKDWPRHVCITGMSGSGKTTFALNILKNFIEKDKPFLVFDWKKSFRPLIQADPKVMCFTVGNSSISNLFKTNINRPPKGVNPKEWINTLCDLLTESFNVSFGVHKILLETLDETFQGWGVYEGSGLYPNWEHVRRMLEAKARDSKGRETGWYESALRIATVLTFGDFGKVVNYDGKRSLSVEDLFDKRVIFELNSLSNIEKKFFCEYILTYIYKLKKAGNEKSTQEFNHAILVDEAHNIFLKKEAKFMSESVTDMIYREMREYGTSLICLDQHSSKLSDTVIGNSACHVAFQQQLPQDLDEISSLMQLRDRKEIFTQLPVGSAIVKLSERYNSPFLIEVPFTDLRSSSVEDSKIKSKMDCVIEGFEIEKNDPEFKEKVVHKETPKEVKIHEKAIIKAEKAKEKEIVLVEDFNKTQKVLFEFVKSKLSEGKTLIQVERLLDSGIVSGYYSKKDVLIVVNRALSEKLKVKQEKEVVQNGTPIKENIKLPDTLTKEELSLVNFLMSNLNHNLATVKLYQLIGLSSRKGNVVKDKLLEKGIIQIEEERNVKGWKKLIKLSPSYSIN